MTFIDKLGSCAEVVSLKGEKKKGHGGPLPGYEFLNN